MNFKAILVSVGATLFLAMAAAPPASAADPVNVRGTVVSLNGSTLTVKTRDGATSAVALKDGWKLTGLAAAAVDDIGPGDYVGIASMQKAPGADGALEVLILPAALKGSGEGSFPWDLKPSSAMTNATVLNTVKDVDGRVLTLTYHGQEKKISVAAGIPIVTFAPATPADLAPGATIFTPAERGADGALTSGFVVVGTNGVVPPM